MSAYLCKQDGPWSTLATWAKVAAGTGATLIAGTNSTLSLVTYAYTAAFTVTTGQTLDGVALNLKRNGTVGGTFTVTLSDDNGVTPTREVVVDTADLPPDRSWVFFKFGSTLTSDGGTDYKIGIKSSIGNAVSVYRGSTAGDWERAVRTTADATALSAADDFIITGELTGQGAHTHLAVTMDLTSASITQWGIISIGTHGTLQYGNAAGTNYYLKLAGDFTNWGWGRFIGSYVGAETPRDSTAILEQNPASDGASGFLMLDGCYARTHGLSRTIGKNIVMCSLNTDEAVNQTVLGVDTDCGFLANDEVVITATRRNVSHGEVRSVSSNDATTLTVSAGLTYAHDGTGELKADIGLLTRNFKIRSASATAMSYLYIGATADVDFEWTEFRYFGEASGTKYGITGVTTTGAATFGYCAFRDFEDGGVEFSATSADNINVHDCVFDNLSNLTSSRSSLSVSVSNTGTNVFFRDCLVARMTGMSGSNGITINNAHGTYQRLKAASCWGWGIAGSFANAIADGTFSDFKAYVCTLSNYYFANALNLNISNIIAHRGIAYGLTLSGLIGGSFTNLNSLGNATAQITATGLYGVTFDNAVLSAEASYASGSNFYLTGPCVETSINNSDIGSVAQAGSGDINISVKLYARLYLNNTILGHATVPIINQGNLYPYDKSYIACSKYGKSAGAHQTFMGEGIIKYETSVPTGWTSPCLRLIPSDAVIKLESSYDGFGMKCAVDSGNTVTISVKVRKSADYNGSDHRLIVRRSVAAGIANDTVLDTMTAAVDTDETLTGTTASVTDDAVIGFAVDCDGTVGSVYVDDWVIS